MKNDSFSYENHPSSSGWTILTRSIQNDTEKYIKEAKRKVHGIHTYKNNENNEDVDSDNDDEDVQPIFSSGSFQNESTFSLSGTESTKDLS